MSQFHIQGNTPLYGSVRLGGAKNASFKLMIASLLCQNESKLLNFSHISEVDMVSQVIKALGGVVEPRGERMLSIHGKNLKRWQIPQKFGQTSRSAPIFIPILLHKFNKALVPMPGGDKLGRRPINWHIEAMRQMGAQFIQHDSYLEAKTSGLHGITFTFPKNSHTGTETVMLAAVLAKGRTIINNAALEPEVDDLIQYLNNAGARIRRRHHRIIEIDGVKKLTGAVHRITPDRNEAVSYACAAYITKGDIIVENAHREHLEAFLEKCQEIGGGFEVGNFGIRFFYQKPLRSADIITQPHPGFMTDWQPLWAVLATRLKGTSIIHETVYPSRFHYVSDLCTMGAKITLFNPKVDSPNKFYNFDFSESSPGMFHAASFVGQSKLNAGRFVIKDLRHGATLVLAAMAAQGTTILENIEQIDRGYEDLDSRLNSMGAKIKRVSK